MKTYSVIVYKEIRTDVNVTVPNDTPMQDVIALAHLKSENVPQNHWNYVEDSINTDPDTDVQKVLDK